MILENNSAAYFIEKSGIPIAYRYSPPPMIEQGGAVTVVFLSGYNSDMNGTKATWLAAYCAQNSLGFLRFDYTGFGQSGGDCLTLGLSDWLDDALILINRVASGKLLLIGSSMGGWMGLCISSYVRERLAGFIAIAPAINFTEWVWQNNMSEAQRLECKAQGYIKAPDGTIFSQKLFEDGQKHHIADGPIFMECPSILLHGMKDDQVPFNISEKLQSQLVPKAELHLISDGDHRLAREEDLKFLGEHIKKLIKNA